MLDFLKKRSADTQQIKARFDCAHHEQILTRYTCSNGSIQYVMQCTCCKRRTSSPISHNKLSTAQKRDAPAYDTAGQSDYRAKIDQQFEIHRERYGSNAWWSAYTDYLNSPEWRAKSQAVIKRDKGICQSSLRGCTKHATEAHHLTYEHVGDEPLSDLSAICHHCHEIITVDSRRIYRTIE